MALGLVPLWPRGAVALGDLPSDRAAAVAGARLALWGDPFQQGDIWAAHNPYDLAPKLRGTRLFVSFGDGQPGPHDTDTEAQELEQILYPQNIAFVQRLHRLGIPVTVDAYSPGTHEWRYWQRELHRSLPLLLSALQQH